MIRDVGDRGSVRLDPEADCRAGVHDESRRERRALDRPRLLGDVVERQSSRDLTEVDREERRRERAPNSSPEALHRRARAPEVDRHSLVEQGREEPEPFEMVEMEMGEQQVDSPRPSLLQRRPEVTDPGPGVEHEDGAVVQRDLDRGRIPAVVDGLGAGRGDRAPATPDRHAHRLLPPEDDDDADELVRVGEERERGHRHLAVDSVPARDPDAHVRRAALVERDPARQSLDRQLLTIGCPRREALRQVVDPDLAHLGEGASHHRLRGLVVEDHVAALVGDERRRREVRSELAGEDEDQVLLRHASTRPSPTASRRRCPPASPA